jgi:ubiquinone/menaquinone biosynthesis C-methylase UbiE
VAPRRVLRGARGIALQQTYYTQTSSRYDAMHADEPEHERALRHIAAVARSLRAQTALDVGSGTGRGIIFFRNAEPSIRISGIEPNEALRAQAVAKGVPADAITDGTGEHLPYPTDSVDIVFSLAVLHHVPHPGIVVSEMLRVARKGVFLSDSNRFGHGSGLAKVLKLALWSARLWDLAFFIKTRGRNYQQTEGDGIAYSYSVYDSMPALNAWADSTYLIGSGPPRGAGVFSPLLTSPHILACAIRYEVE